MIVQSTLLSLLLLNHFFYRRTLRNST